MDMSSPTRFRLRRKDRGHDPRTATYHSRAGAEAARDQIHASQQAEWEIVPQTSGPSGVSTPSSERSRPNRAFTLAPEIYELIGQLATHMGVTKTGVVETAVTELAERRGVTGQKKKKR